ncbi:DUF6461 domain-containing protein [Streptomyces ambofaciens]|nr:DUF6461 domain-containing protein [Streptomyces ambofaciens]CAI78166.1 unknown hypothetical protein [Streptomyces ambofaciens ATCC 23877]CAJ89224.1 hypothetical protein SAML0237 [Streptomyces ambofaciens ATCC 23877]
MTSTETGRGLDLFREGDFPLSTLTFVRDLPPAELLTRMGVDPETLALRDAMHLSDDLGDDLFDDEEPVVTSGIDGSWTWAWEQGGVHGLDERILSHVSVGTEAVVLHYNEKPMHWFKYAVGGEIIVDFHTLQAIEPEGRDPARLDDVMRPLGLIPGQVAPLHSVLALVENAFDIRLRQPDDVDDECWSGRLLPLPD